MNAFLRSAAVMAAVTAAMLFPARAYASCGDKALARIAPSGLTLSGTPRTLLESAPAFEREPDRVAAIVGLWQVTLTAGGEVIDVGFDAWHADGTETLNDVSPISHNVCLGVWKQTGRRTFELKHPAFRYDAAGNYIGTLILRETNVVNRAGDRFSGTFTIEFFDLAGTSIFMGAGEIVGERVTVD